ncbi:protein CTR9 [Populus alba x Populus x berolinensis]|uniref:RNA polymerase-associated protein CTR9-like n=3 Tax=Populus TaxID=3689 RepID=A0A4U5QR85_POPAL|nr:protein CTR9 homolog [Populus alba]KAJ6923156.1 protein CTR9 [Populus alba x Populus x berolinensis]KAJ6993582.1 protein CTR9 [Populus alba x Populus x berolinensis]TKS13021.1 RNA polymerase-associated protein CTR9-like [Populus alba]
MAYVYIPVQNSEEEVRVALDQLPRDASDILDILKAEQAPLDLWLIIAREYFKQGKLDQFRQILEEGSSHEIDEYYADVRYERIAILNALGAYYSYLGKVETKQREKEEYFIQATKHYNKASRIDMHEPSTWVGKGQLLLAKGEVEQASAAFRIVLEGDRDNVSALLGQACVEYSRGHYGESLTLFKRALQVYPDCPGAVRLGIGHCHYKLGHVGKACLAFQRVLQLDPENVEALVSLAILDLQTNEAAAIRKGMEKMQRAFEIYPYCAMALNYLANHFFFTGQHFLVEQLTETALAVTNHGPTKSHSYYNLARSYHSKGDYETASRYYWASVKEINKPGEFVFPYYGLGQVQLKLGEIKNALSNFEKVLEVYPDNCETLKVLGHIYVQLGQTEKAQEFLRKAAKIDPRDAQAFLDLGELLISTDTGAALDAFKTARSLLKKGGEEVPIEVLNNIAVIHFEREELELALQNFKEALGDGIWLTFLEGKANTYEVDATSSLLQYKDMQIFRRLEEEGHSVELSWNKVTTLFNLARLLEQLHNTETASTLYRLILFKYPDYVDAYLRLAAIAKARNNLPLSIELVNEALTVNDKCPNALSMLGDLELKNDDWVKAKETFRAASEATDGKDSYATLSLGNWNYFAAIRNEKRNPKLEATHLEKAKELYTRVLVQHTANLYAANGAGVVLAEKGHFDVSKDLFTQVQEAASGSIFVQMPDVWINLAHVYFAQGNFALAVKMYQNCLQKFFYNTDSQILLYLARTHYEAEQWQDCKRTLLRAIHLTPSNYTLRFDAGVAMQKFSASTLQKTKRTVDEVRSTVDELENAVRLFSQLSAASNLYFNGFDEKKINTHVEYCKHLLEAAIVHREAAEREEQQNRQRLDLARQMALAEEARRKAEEQRKFQLERRKQEDELKRVRQQEEHFERVKEQWKSSTSASKRRDRADIDDGEGGHGEKRRRKGGKRRKKEKSSRSRYEMEEADMMDDHDEPEDDDANVNFREPGYQMNDQDDNAEENAQDVLAAAGLEDSDADDDAAAPSSAGRRKRAWSESDEDEISERKPQSSLLRENSADLQDSDGEFRDKRQENAAADDED